MLFVTECLVQNPGFCFFEQPPYVRFKTADQANRFDAEHRNFKSSRSQSKNKARSASENSRRIHKRTYGLMNDQTVYSEEKVSLIIERCARPLIKSVQEKI